MCFEITSTQFAKAVSAPGVDLARRIEGCAMPKPRANSDDFLTFEHPGNVDRHRIGVDFSSARGSPQGADLVASPAVELAVGINGIAAKATGADAHDGLSRKHPLRGNGHGSGAPDGSAVSQLT